MYMYNITAAYSSTSQHAHAKCVYICVYYRYAHTNTPCPERLYHGLVQMTVFILVITYCCQFVILGEVWPSFLSVYAHTSNVTECICEVVVELHVGIFMYMYMYILRYRSCGTYN